MTKTIAINAGSSSLKWQLYEMPEEVVLAKGLIERIGLRDSVSTVKFADHSESQTLDIADHVQAVKILLDDLIRFDIIKSYDEITGVGHRVVAGGEYFKESSLVDEYALAKIEELSALAPLHNPGAASGIRAFKELLPDITSVAVLIQLFIHLCQKWLTVTQFLTVIIQTIKFVNTEHTELATNMFLKKQLSY